MLRRQKNRSAIDRAKKSIRESLEKNFPDTMHAIQLATDTTSREAALIIKHALHGTMFVTKNDKGWLLERKGNTAIDCTNLAHVKKCLIELLQW